jgi:hypothetical protein
MTTPITIGSAPRSSLEWIDAYGVARSRPQSAAVYDAINPYLIGIALIYVVWSYFALASSIWVRAIFACYLIMRMRPDIIIPYCLSCLQLRLSLGAVGPGNLELGVDDVYQNLTGYESYAFALPPVLLVVRTFLAIISGKVDWRRFPLGLYLLWGFGGLFVVAGALHARAAGQGWTASLRIYCTVAAVFYGLLMPRLTPQQSNRLTGGLGVIAFVLLCLAGVGMFRSQLLFVLEPLAVGWAVSGVLSQKRVAYSGLLLALSSANALIDGTLMMRMNWFWSVLAGIYEWCNPPRRGGSASRIAIMVVATVVACLALFVTGIVFHTTEKMAMESGLLGRLHYKLYTDRGPIWAGALRYLLEEPSIMAIPGQPFLIHSHDKEVLWRFGPHNLLLEAFRQLGMIAGPIALVVLAWVVVQCTKVIGRDGTPGSRVVASTAICCIVVGGTTLPFVLGDRQGEVILMAVGLVIASCLSQPGAATSAALPTSDGAGQRPVGEQAS